MGLWMSMHTTILPFRLAIMDRERMGLDKLAKRKSSKRQERSTSDSMGPCEPQLCLFDSVVFSTSSRFNDQSGG